MAFNNGINSQQRLAPNDGPTFAILNLGNANTQLRFCPSTGPQITLSVPAVPAANRIYEIADLLANGNVVVSTELEKMEVYLNQNKQTSSIIWAGSATTTSGVATFFPTTTNTVGGTALFTAIDVAIPVGVTNTSSAVAVPQCAIKTVSVDLKTITVNAVTGTTLLALGPTQVFAPNGTVVNLLIRGR